MADSEVEVDSEFDFEDRPKKNKKQRKFYRNIVQIIK